MHTQLLAVWTIVNDAWQDVALVVGGFALLRANRRIAAVERQLHRERAGATVLTVYQPPSVTTLGSIPVVYRYDGVQE